MNEEEVKRRVKRWLEESQYTVHEEVGVSGTNREIVLDFYGYKDSPSILWVECKGDQSLSELLEGFIRTEFAVFSGGGRGILATPKNARKKLLKYEKFLKGSSVQVLDVESYQLYSFQK